MRFLIKMLLFFITIMSGSLPGISQNCRIVVVNPDAGDLVFYAGDTVKLKFVINGEACRDCKVVCKNCENLEYALNDNYFLWTVPHIRLKTKTELKFSTACDKASELLVPITAVPFGYKFLTDFESSIPHRVKSELIAFLAKKGARVTQINVNEGDSIYFSISTPVRGPGRISLVQTFRSFDGVTYADSKSVVVRWVPSYKDYKRDPIHELRVSIANGLLSNDPDAVFKSIKFKISLRNNIPPIIDGSKSTTIDLDTNGDTYINLSDYFIPAYDRGDNILQFDYSPKDLACIQPNPYNNNELIVHKSLYLNSQPKPSTITVKAKHSNSPYSQEVRLILKDHFEPLAMALENRKFSFYDDEKIDETIRIDFNETYRLDKSKVTVLGDTALYDLKKNLRFDDQDPQYLRLFSNSKIEIDDSMTDDLQYLVRLRFLNALNRESFQTLLITLHPRVDGDRARLFFKNRVDSLKIFLDSVRTISKRIESEKIKRGNKIDWFSKGVSFIAIIVGSYGAAKNPANYGYSIMGGLGMGVLFVDLKQIRFFATKKYLQVKSANERLVQLEDEVEKHLMSDVDKMGASFFDTNYRTSDFRDHTKLSEEFSDIMRHQHNR